MKKYFEELLNIALNLKDKDLINFLSSKRKIFRYPMVYINDSCLINSIKTFNFNLKISNIFRKNKKYDIGIFNLKSEKDIENLKNFLNIYSKNFEKILIYVQSSKNLSDFEKILDKYLIFNKEKELIDYLQKVNLRKLENQKKIIKNLEKMIKVKLENIIFHIEEIQKKKEYLKNFILNLQNYYIKKVEINLDSLKNILKEEINNFINSLKPREILFNLNNELKKLKLEINHITPIIFQKCNSIFDSEMIIKQIKKELKDYPEDILKEIEYELYHNKEIFKKIFEKLPQKIYKFFKYRFENLKILFGISITFILISIAVGLSGYKNSMYIFGLLSCFIFILFLFSYFLFNFLLKRSFDFYLRRKIANLKSNLVDYFINFFERLYDKLVKDLNIKENELKIKQKHYENLLEILKDIKSEINLA